MPPNCVSNHPTLFPSASPHVSRVLIDHDPFSADATPDVWGARVWPASWVWLGDDDAGTPVVAAFRRRFRVSDDRKPIALHVAADEQYELFLNGRSVGRGSERSDGTQWHFDSYLLDLAAGEHVLVARVWALGNSDHLAPAAQMSIRPGFLAAAEGPWQNVLSTGHAPWEAKPLRGYEHLAPPVVEANQFAGGFEAIDGRTFEWGFQDGSGRGWTGVAVTEPAQTGHFAYGERNGRHALQPATLPPQRGEATCFSTVRWVNPLLDTTAPDPVETAVSMADHDPAAARAWSVLTQGAAGHTGPTRAEPPGVVVPAHTRIRVILDAEDYLTGHPELTVSGGRNASVRMHWAEALFDAPHAAASGDAGAAIGKGNRDAIDGKYFRGKGDRFVADGGTGRVFSSLGWRAGRYAELVIETIDQPLRLDSLVVRQSHYPLADRWAWTSSEPRLDAALPLMRTSLRACMHDQFIDCPYYEQLMYTGDTRLQALTCYLLSPDDRLARKAIRLQEASRLPNGLTQARFPCRDRQIIPGFSLWWIGMVHDAAVWRGDVAWVREMMPGVRAVTEAWRTFRNHDGLVEAPDGWNFVDWVDGWDRGCPPGATDGINATLNLHLAWTLRLKADLESWMGEPELAHRDRRDAYDLCAATTGACWNAGRGLFAETPGGDAFSEHAQCMALLSGLLDGPAQRRTRKGLMNDPSLDRCTVYFSFYLLEALGQARQPQAFFAQLDRWYGMKSLGLICTPESPEPSRSDCHAWGAHPLFHLYATILGLRPSAYGMDHLDIRPMLGPLKHISGRCAHPRGEIRFHLDRHDTTLTGFLELPPGVRATAHLADDPQSFTGRIDF